MHTRSTNVAPSPICFLACQHHLLLHKNSTVDVPVIFMFWIIICANCIFSLYAFPSTHFEDDDECGGNLTTNGWIFNIHFFLFFSILLLFILFLTISVLPPTFICAHPFEFPFPSLFIVIFQLHFLHSYCCELQNFENTQNFQQQTQIDFENYPIFFIFWTSCMSHSFFHLPIVLINIWSLKLI